MPGHAITNPRRNNGARHHAYRENLVPGTTVFPAGPRTDTTPSVDCAIRQYRYFPGASSPLLAHHPSEKPQQEAQMTNYRLLQAATDKTLTPQPLAGC
ncbi:MAG: hypothetical protein KatS3mg110_4605 [Pirellulaceae bacterium]|nr:MAG: hypothetical protein KatS3mg110_4605 [Pirellulaceae bacterium]